MNEFKIKTNAGESIMRLPTSLKEITSDYLLGITNGVNIAPNHALIAVVYRCKIMEAVNASKKSRAMSTTIVPLFIKANVPEENENEIAAMFKNINVSDKIIIAGTDIERGYRIVSKRNTITLENVIRAYNDDKEFSKTILVDQNYYYFVDIKLVPINDIKGFYSEDITEKFENPFIKVNTNSIVN